MLDERTQADLAMEIGREPRLSVLVLQSLCPIGGSKLEDASGGPGGEQAEEVAQGGRGLEAVGVAAGAGGDAGGGGGGEQTEEVAQVGRGLEAVELAAGEERDEGGVDVAGLVAADEEP